MDLWSSSSLKAEGQAQSWVLAPCWVCSLLFAPAHPWAQERIISVLPNPGESRKSILKKGFPGEKIMGNKRLEMFCWFLSAHSISNLLLSWKSRAEQDVKKGPWLFFCALLEGFHLPGHWDFRGVISFPLGDGRSWYQSPGFLKAEQTHRGLW